jgi:hypothetical protein
MMVARLREREYGALATLFYHIAWVETQLIALVEPNCGRNRLVSSVDELGLLLLSAV